MMRFFQVRTLVAAAVIAFAASDAAAQQPGRPSADEARALLSARPELVQQLRQRLATSGMTRDQIRARLRAEGYPENLLDPYLPGAVGDADAPSSDLYSAI
jgi:hypothetical protein